MSNMFSTQAFEVDALGIPNVYFICGNRQNATPVGGNEQIPISGVFDLSNIYGLKADGTPLEGDDGSSTNPSGGNTLNRFISVKFSDPFYYNGGVFGSGGYTGGSVGLRKTNGQAVLDPSLGSGISPGDVSSPTAIIGSNVMGLNCCPCGFEFLSRRAWVSVGDLLEDRSFIQNGTFFTWAITTEDNALGPAHQSPFQGNANDDNVMAHGEAYDVCRMEPYSSRFREVSGDNSQINDPVGFITLTRGLSGNTNNLTNTEFFLEVNLLRFAAATASTTTEFIPPERNVPEDYTTAKQLKQTTIGVTVAPYINSAQGLANHLNGLDLDGNPIPDFATIQTGLNNEGNIFFGGFEGSACVDRSGNVFLGWTTSGKLIKLVTNQDTTAEAGDTDEFTSGTFSVIKHSKLVPGNGGYNADGTEKTDRNGFPVDPDNNIIKPVCPSAMICDTTNAFGVKGTDSDGNSYSLDDRVLFAFLMDAENSIVDPGGVGRIPGATDQDTRRGLYIIILNEDKTKVAFDPNNEEFDYRAIYFYPAREFFNDGFGETVCFPTFLNLGAINGSTEANRMKNRVRTCGASMRPLLREE